MWRGIVGRVGVGIFGVVAFIVVGTVFLVLSRAATPFLSAEAEAGTKSGCLADVADSAASGGSAIKFSACASGLDATGTTIPDTNYPVPNTNVVFMSPTGNDTAAGTTAAPLATLNAAITKVPAGGTIIARAGTYREGGIKTTKVFTLQAYPHEKVWFDGTNVVNTGWTSDGAGHWYIGWETPTFCAGKYYSTPYNKQQAIKSCSWGEIITGYSDPPDNTIPIWGKGDYGIAGHEAATDPQLVFFNGAYVHEVTSLAQVTAGSNNFWYDQMGTHRIYIAQNPTTLSTIEIAKYPNLMKVEGGAGGNVLRGVGVRRYATDVYAPNFTRGAVLFNVPNSTVENSVFTEMAGDGLIVADARGAIVRSSVFAANGFSGFESAGHSTTGSFATVPDNILVEDSVFNLANNEGFGCGYACGISNMKFNHMNGGVVRNNIFQNGLNASKGFWCDENCNHMQIVNNISRGNASHGIFYEISDTGIIASNLVYANGSYGIKMGSANTKIYNNTLINNTAGNMLLYDDIRDPDGSKQGPNTAGNTLFNNIFYTDNGTSLFEIQTGKADTAANQFLTGFDYNFYFRAAAKPANLIGWAAATATTNFLSLSTFRTATGLEAHGQDITTGTDPFFTNVATKDYTVRAGSVAKTDCLALPADVAAAIGVAVSAGAQCGALRVYPNGSL